MKKALAAPVGFAAFTTACIAVTAAACVVIARETREIMLCQQEIAEIQRETLEILRKAQVSEGRV